MTTTTKMRPAMESRLPLSKKQRKDLNRKLAAALRAEGLSPNGEVWEDAKGALAQGLTPKAAARLVRSVLPAEEQDAAIARKREVTITEAPVAQVPTPDFSALLEALVTAETVAEVEAEAEATERTVVLSSRAIDVREGRVRRDDKGRLLPNR